MRSTMLTLFVLFLMANLSCQYQGSSHPVTGTAIASRASTSAEVSATAQPAPAEPTVEIGPTTPARILAASNQAMIESEGLKITLPTTLTLWCGWIGEIPVKIENSTAATREVTLYARPPVNVFVGGKTIRRGQENGAIEVLRTTVAANEIKALALEMQSLRVGKLDVPLSGLGQEVSFQLDSPVIERGAYFMYRCWFEGSDFFRPIWSNGQRELDAAAHRAKIVETARELIRNGAKRDQAEREAKRRVLEKFPGVTYELDPNWQEIYEQKKNSHPEICGFQYVDIDGLGWNHVELTRGQYNWAIGDFMLKLWADHFGAEPFVRIELPPDWVALEKNPSGTWGFFDPQNEILMKHWEDYCAALAERYNGDGQNDVPGGYVVDNYILNNEPEGSWLNVDFDREGWPVERSIAETDWWNDLQSQWGARAYAQKFGDLIYETTVRAARAIHQANPRARVATPQFAIIESTKEMFDYLLGKGIGREIDAWGIHPCNDLSNLWQGNTEAAGLWWLEDSRNQAPPFESDDLTRVKGALDRKDQILRTARPVEEIRQENPYMGKLWRKLIDEPFSRDLEAFIALFSRHGVDVPFWATEMHEIGPLAGNRRENLIAALRGYSIVFHLKVEATVVINNLGSITGSKVSPLPDPIARDLIVDIGRALGGANPVAKFESQWFVPGENEHLDYRWVVYKLFNRGDEDIIAVWSNSSKMETLELDLDTDADLRNIRMTKFDAGKNQFKTITALNQFPRQITIAPLKQFYFVSVTSDKPKFGWLNNIRRQISSQESDLISDYHDAAGALERLKQSLRSRREDIGRFKAIHQMLGKGEDNLIMGDFGQAQQILDEINQMINRF